MQSAVPLDRADQIDLLERHAFPDWDAMPGEDSDPFEPKESDWGRIDGRLVALDYSLPVYDTEEERVEQLRAALADWDNSQVGPLTICPGLREWACSGGQGEAWRHGSAAPARVKLSIGGGSDCVRATARRACGKQADVACFLVGYQRPRELAGSMSAACSASLTALIRTVGLRSPPLPTLRVVWCRSDMETGDQNAKRGVPTPRFKRLKSTRRGYLKVGCRRLQKSSPCESPSVPS